MNVYIITYKATMNVFCKYKYVHEYEYGHAKDLNVNPPFQTAYRTN